MINQNYKIIVDFDIKDTLSEYMDVCQINFQRLDLSVTEPLIDVIRHKASGADQILLIIRWKTLERLLAEKSPHNEFRQMCLENKIKVCINSSEDPFFNWIF